MIKIGVNERVAGFVWWSYGQWGKVSFEDQIGVGWAMRHITAKAQQ